MDTMRFLLINPHISTTATAGHYKRFLTSMPPISLAYVAAALRDAGADVRVFDDYTHGGDPAELERVIRDAQPHAVGLTCVTPTARRTLDIAEQIKKNHPDIKLVLGNIHASVYYREILERGLADIIVMGEGEDTVTDLAPALESGASLRDVPGIAYRDNGEIILTPQRAFTDDLDALPYPAWDLFPLERYRLFSFAVVREPGTLVLGSRGCPYGCNFCSLKIMGKKRRRRSAASIADEFQWLLDEFGYVQMSFIDPMFPFTKKEGIEFSEELIRRGLHEKIVWTTETRVDHVDQELLDTMRRSGLRRIMYGFEAGGQEGIDAINKSFKIDQARSAVAMTKKAGVQIIGFFMLGVPGETTASADRTIDYSVSLGIDFAKYTVFSPFPGTRVYEDMKASGQIPAEDDPDAFTNYPTKDRPPVFIPEGLTNDDIVRLQRKAFLKFYLQPKQILNQLFRVRSLKLSDMINGLRLVLGV